MGGSQTRSNVSRPPLSLDFSSGVGCPPPDEFRRTYSGSRRAEFSVPLEANKERRKDCEANVLDNIERATDRKRAVLGKVGGGSRAAGNSGHPIGPFGAPCRISTFNSDAQGRMQSNESVGKALTVGWATMLTWPGSLVRGSYLHTA